MSTEALTIRHRPKLTDAILLLGFSGWMDGAEVSTGSVEYLANRLDAVETAEIDPAPFYIYNFPGSMEVTSLFRPHVKIEEGIVTHCEEPRSVFSTAPAQNLVLFKGKEPNLRWGDYAACVFEVASALNVTRMYFVGTVAGLVPHTREPRIHTSVSDASLLPHLKRHGCAPSNYEGPGSFVTSLSALAQNRGVPLTTLVAEIPAYVQGRNVKCIHAMLRRLSAVADLEIDYDDLAAESREFEAQLNGAVAERPDLAEMVAKMEEDYDQRLSQKDDEELRAWLQRQGIRLE